MIRIVILKMWYRTIFRKRRKCRPVIAPSELEVIRKNGSVRTETAIKLTMYKLSVPRSVQLCGYDLHCSRLNVVFKFSVLLVWEYRFDIVIETQYKCHIKSTYFFWFLLKISTIMKNTRCRFLNHRKFA